MWHVVHWTTPAVASVNYPVTDTYHSVFYSSSGIIQSRRVSKRRLWTAGGEGLKVGSMVLSTNWRRRRQECFVRNCNSNQRSITDYIDVNSLWLHTKEEEAKKIVNLRNWNFTVVLGCSSFSVVAVRTFFIALRLHCYNSALCVCMWS